MIGWADTDVWDNFPLTGRITVVGLYWRYFIRHMRKEMQNVSDYLVVVALWMPNPIRPYAKSTAIIFSEQQADL
jgi:hypothetical protein